VRAFVLGRGVAEFLLVAAFNAEFFHGQFTFYIKTDISRPDPFFDPFFLFAIGGQSC
jgi:hypothetical protein